MTQSSPIRALQCRCLTVLAGAIRHFPAAFCVGGGNVWQHPSPCLLAPCWVWQVGKPSRRLEERSVQSGYLFPAGCIGGFLSPVTAPQGSISLGLHSHTSGLGELLPSTPPSDLTAITCSSLTHCVSTHTGPVLNPP